MSKVLVVGGGGYVGGYLVDELIQSGHEVGVFDLLLYEDRFLKPVKFYLGNISDTSDLLAISRDYEVVIWLAALVGDPLCALDENLTKEVNTEAPLRFRTEFDGEFVFMSTCSVYGAQDGLLDEDSPTNPLSIYAQTKLRSEEGLLSIGKPNLILRLGTLFGISDAHARLRADLVLNVLVIRAVYSKQLTVFGGEQFRPLLHVRDVGRAIVSALNAGIHGKFNLHCENISIVGLAERISHVVPDVKIVRAETSFQDSRNYSVSSNLFKEMSDFSPKYSIEHGIVELHEALLSGRFPNILNSNYINVDKMRGTYLPRKNPTLSEYWRPLK